MAKILLVDDDELFVLSLKTLLRTVGYEVVTASDGLQGLQAALGQSPDLILLDARMPVLDGFGMLAALRANAETRGVSCMMLTALDDRESLDKALRHGADAMLLKPVQTETLLQAIAHRVELVAARKSAGPSAVAITPQELQTARDADQLDALLTESSARAPFRESRQVTVLFSDIRNFSRLSEILPSSEVAEVLQTYYERVAAARGTRTRGVAFRDPHA